MNIFYFTYRFLDVTPNTWVGRIGRRIFQSVMPAVRSRVACASVITTSEQYAWLPALTTSATTKFVTNMEPALLQFTVRRVTLCSGAASRPADVYNVKNGVSGPWRASMPVSATTTSAPHVMRFVVSSLSSRMTATKNIRSMSISAVNLCRLERRASKYDTYDEDARSVRLSCSAIVSIQLTNPLTT